MTAPTASLRAPNLALGALAGILASRAGPSRLPPGNFDYLFAPAPANGEPSPLWEQFGAYPGAHLGFGGFGVGGGANFTPSYGLRGSIETDDLSPQEQLAAFGPGSMPSQLAGSLPRLAALRAMLSAASVGRASAPAPIRAAAGGTAPRRM